MISLKNVCGDEFNELLYCIIISKMNIVYVRVTIFKKKKNKNWTKIITIIFILVFFFVDF